MIVTLVFFAAVAYARIQTVALPLRQPTGLDPLSLLAETDFCSVAAVGSRDSGMLRQVALSLATPSGGNDSSASLYLDERAVFGVAPPLRCALRFSENHLLSLRRSGGLVDAAASSILPLGCAAHGRRSLHGAASGPCDGSLNIGAHSSLWSYYGGAEISHNRLLLVSRGRDEGREHRHASDVYAPCVNAPGVKMCGVWATLQLGGEQVRALVDVDLSTPFHALEGHTALLAEVAASPTSRIELTIGEQTLRIPLRVSNEWLHETAIEQFDDDDDVLVAGEHAQPTGAAFSASVRTSLASGDTVRLTLGTLLLRKYALRLRSQVPERLTAIGFVPHDGRSNLDSDEAVLLFVAVCVFVASLCHSAETAARVTAAVGIRVRYEPDAVLDTRTSWIPRALLAAGTLVCAVASLAIVEARTAHGVDSLRTATHVQLGLAALSLVCAPFIRRVQGGRSLVFRGRAELAVALAAEMVALSLLVLVTAVWHEGEHLESAGSAIVGAVIIANYARHAHHLADFWTVGNRLYRQSARIVDAVTLASALVVSAGVFAQTFACTVHQDVLSAAIVAVSIVAGGAVSRTYRDAAITGAVAMHGRATSSLNVPI